MDAGTVVDLGRAVPALSQHQDWPAMTHLETAGLFFD